MKYLGIRRRPRCWIEILVLWLSTLTILVVHRIRWQVGAFTSTLSIPTTSKIWSNSNILIRDSVLERLTRQSTFTLFAVSKEEDDVSAKFEDTNDNSPSQRRNTDDDTQRMIQAQQKQIDALMEMLQSKNGGSTSASKVESSAPVAAPLKVMLFIDGTWLYYSIFERENQNCPIMRRFGKGWQYKYFVDWKRLPALLCEALREQDHGWSSVLPSDVQSSSNALRPMEIVRAMVFTSYKKDTPKTSFRYQMYQDMIAANYDVNLLETVGNGEKCVDIQLAVEMLHYATVPNAYDVALLLTGDKDFMPAMVRTRQKGRRVGLVSMRNACNKALTETPNIKDFNVVWIEDYLDDLMKPIKDNNAPGRTRRRSYISKFTLMKIISDFVLKLSIERLSIRDIGRYLKDMKVGDRSLSDEIKESFGGLYQFLVVSDLFELTQSDQDSRAFWVALRSDYKEKMTAEAEKTNFNDFETKFFENYRANFGKTERRELLDVLESTTDTRRSQVQEEGHQKPNFEKCTVPQLKNYCRIHKLKVSGTKGELLERILEHEKALVSDSTQSPPGHPTEDSNEEESAEVYISNLIREYIQVKGGKASSRDVGRYLGANKCSPHRRRNETKWVSALQELKDHYGSLNAFVKESSLFYIDRSDSRQATDKAFTVSIMDS